MSSGKASPFHFCDALIHLLQLHILCRCLGHIPEQCMKWHSRQQTSTAMLQANPLLPSYALVRCCRSNAVFSCRGPRLRTDPDMLRVVARDRVEAWEAMLREPRVSSGLDARSTSWRRMAGGLALETQHFVFSTHLNGRPWSIVALAPGPCASRGSLDRATSGSPS